MAALAAGLAPASWEEAGLTVLAVAIAAAIAVLLVRRVLLAGESISGDASLL